jgi:hypothetical protein
MTTGLSDSLKHWSSLKYHDPAQVLRQLRALEGEISASDLPDRVKRLRTNDSKRYREGRDAAVFTYGMSVVHGGPVYYATEERDDYDFVALWADQDTQHFTPVQLKELVPADLNPTATLEDLVTRLADSVAPSQTVLAVKLNRRGQFDLDKITLPKLPWSEVWFFWSSSPDQSQWSIWGDALTTPIRIDFEYPT